MTDECAVCGERLDGDEPHPTIDGEPVCANADECTKRWVSLARELRRERIRNLDPVTNVETRVRHARAALRLYQARGTRAP